MKTNKHVQVIYNKNIADITTEDNKNISLTDDIGYQSNSSVKERHIYKEKPEVCYLIDKNSQIPRIYLTDELTTSE